MKNESNICTNWPGNPTTIQPVVKRNSDDSVGTLRGKERGTLTRVSLREGLELDTRDTRVRNLVPDEPKDHKQDPYMWHLDKL